MGFTENNLVLASSKKTGNIGDYVAMAWPPMRVTEIIINEITGINQVQTNDDGDGSLVEYRSKRNLKNSIVINN